MKVQEICVLNWITPTLIIDRKQDIRKDGVGSTRTRQGVLTSCAGTPPPVARIRLDQPRV